MRILLALSLLLAGCSFPPDAWDSPEPAARLNMVLKSHDDPTAIPHLIESLEHDDPLVRMAAIRVLEDLTGQTLGYDYAAPLWQRQERVAAWMDWYRQQGPETRPQPKTQSPARPIEGGAR